MGIGPPVPIAITLLEDEVMAAGIDTSLAAWFMYHASNRPEVLYVEVFIRRMGRASTKADIRRLLKLSITKEIKDVGRLTILLP